MNDQYDEGLPKPSGIRWQAGPDQPWRDLPLPRMRIHTRLPSLDWRADPYPQPFYPIDYAPGPVVTAATKFPKETPMIDLNQPLYDQHGNRWHALTGPDGRAFVTPEHVAFLVSEGDMAFPASFDAKSGGFLSSIWNDYVLTNTPPKPDWQLRFQRDHLDDFITVRYGRRSGKLFAEVVE